MRKRFEPGDTVKCMNAPATVVKWLAEGGQGDVYIVEQFGQQKALKWYKPGGMGKNPEAFYENLKQNYLNGSPDKEIFLWPEDITEKEDGTFGYVMPLRPAGYYEVSEFLLTKRRFRSMKTAIDAALNIVSAFRMLHNNGYSYQDLNDGNFFINPDNGKILICDNDNVAPEGTSTGIIGKPGYIAPEIILGEKMPDSYSDRFSMSIIIFMLFTLTRPLEGRRTLGDTPRTGRLMTLVYGEDPHFIMEDPGHPEYGYDKHVQRNVGIFWKELPSYMRDFFQNAFSQKAIQNPGARPTELDWIKVLVRLRSDFIQCQCGQQYSIDRVESKVCDRCGRIIRIPYRLSISTCNYEIPGIPGSRIYTCQLGPCNANDALIPVGRVLANRANVNQLGICNLTQKHWDAETPSGKNMKVAPKGVVPLKNGIKLMIDNAKILIEEN